MSADSIAWPEFTCSMCDRLNTERCLLVAALDAKLAAEIAAMVNGILSPDDSGGGGDASAMPAACRSATTTASSSADGAQPLSTCHSRAAAPSLAALFRVKFTTAESIPMLEGCTAVHGRAPMLAVLDMMDDDDSHAFVLDLTRPADPAPSSPPPDADQPLCSSSSVAVVSRAEVAAFLSRVAAGTEPRARQGSAPAVADLCEPRHGVVLAAGRAAVTSSYARLVRSAADDEGGGALVVFWSDRCPCCPGVLMLLEAIVWGLRRLANGLRDTVRATRAAVCFPQRSYGNSSSKGCSGGGSGACPAAAAVPVPLPPLMLFPYLVCNIDENDYPPEVWPLRSAAAKNRLSGGGGGSDMPSTLEQQQQCVPSVIGYSHSGRMERVPFTQPRTAANLVRFLVGTCVCPALVSFRFHEKFAEAAAEMAAALDTDALMSVFGETDPALAEAAALREALSGESTPAAIEDAVARIDRIVQAHLDASCTRGQGSTISGCTTAMTVAAAADAALATATACCARAKASGSPPPCAAAAAVGGSGTGGRENQTDMCCLLSTRPASPTPLFSTAASAVGVKRRREAEEADAEV